MTLIRAPYTGLCLSWALFGVLLGTLFGAVSVLPVSAQNQAHIISGVVTDAETSMALPGANVRLLGPMDRGTATDLEGRYAFTLSPGLYSVSVTFVGYEPYQLDGLELSAGSTSELDVRLWPGNTLINPITVTASRKPEKLLDAPASITVLEPKELESRNALTAAAHLTSVPGVDVIKTGLVSSRVAIRGFNDNIASSLLTLVDNRIARAPSVRLTALQLIPMSNGDIEQIEVVSGPASALYGPNTTSGVVHMMTKSPFDSRGTSVSLAGGQQDVLLGSIRHAGTRGKKLGYKVSAQYYTGTDFEYIDPQEIIARQQALTAGAQPDTLLIGRRNYGVKNLSLSSRLDYRFNSNTTLSFNAGVTRGNNIEVTPTGAAQVENARIGYGQVRFTRGNFFAQAYGNLMNSGTSYFLRTGQIFRDVSRMFVSQVQHHSQWSNAHRFTYGIDAFYTQPEGEGTVNGRNEGDDNVFEIGAYLQSESTISDRLSLVGAARVDYHDQLDLYSFSPRAAIVFKPSPSQTARITFNQAFRTPLPNDLFSDVLGQADAFTLGQMEPLLGFAPTTDLRVQGMLNGFRFSRSGNGIPQFRSPFAQLDPRGLTTSDYIDLNDPQFTNVMWDVARQSAVAGLADNLVSQGILDASVASSLSLAMDRVLPQDVTGVLNVMQILDLESQAFIPIENVSDFSKLDATRIRTYDIGYKGIFAKAFMASVDIYHTEVQNFVGPFAVGTPNVFLESASLNKHLISELREALSDPANAGALTDLNVLDTSSALFGNSDGDPAPELAFLLSAGLAGAIPFGTVSPTTAFDPTAVMLMRRNFGNISVNGADFNLTAFLSRQLRIGVMYSWLSDNFFANVEGIDDISLNAPRHKGGGQFFYETKDGRLGLSLRGRYVEGFPVRSDVYVGSVESFVVFDGSVHYRVPFSKDTRMNLTVQNLTDNKHREFVFVPEIGRLATLRLTHEF